MRKELASLHQVIQFLLFLLAGLISMGILMLLIVLIYALSSGNIGELAQLTENLNTPSSINLLKWLQIAQSIGLFMVPYFLYRWANRETVAYTYFGKRNAGKMALIFGITMFAAYPFINLMAVWNSGLHLPEALAGIETWMRATEAEAEGLIQQFLTMEGPVDLLFNLLVIAVFPAVGEELFFRGFMQNSLLKMLRNQHVAIWITAFIFSAIHMQFLGFFPRLLLGAMLGYAAMFSGSLIVPVIGHFINNGLAVLLTYIYGMDMMDTPEGLSALDMQEVTLGLISGLVLFSGMWFLSKQQKFEA